MFFTSDWHVGHEKSLIHDHRPFRNLAHMHEVLINNYNSIVPKDGICYFLGDVGWKEALPEVIPQLQGTKIVILGNHDKGREVMMAAGFVAVLNSGSFTIGRDIITMSHCPLRGVYRESAINQDGEQMKNFKPFESWHGESRHDAYSLPDFGQFHLHGHTHKRKGGNEVISGKQWDIGVVGNDWRPVSFSQIESWVAKYGRNKNG